MEVSNNLYELLQNMEGLKLLAYQDGADVWTIGYGTTRYKDGSRVKEGDTCTLEQAKDLVNFAVKSIVLSLNKNFQSLNQGQFDSLVDFIYNAGLGAWMASSLRTEIIKDPNSDNISFFFSQWNKIHKDGVLVASDGLTRRRKCEYYLYKNGVNHPTFYV